MKLSSSLSNPLSQCPTSVEAGPWQCPVYNALGQRVEDYQADSQGNPMTLTYPQDIFGQRTGTFAQWPSQNWTGWNVYWSQVAGQRLNMGGASAYIDHADAVGSTTMETDPSGAVQWDVTHYPWGRVFQEQGTRQSEVAMGLDWQVNDPTIPSATREYNFRIYRWMTPDPFGGHLEDPQTLNKYVYAGNNPTSLNDPSGRDIWLKCGGGSDKSHCRGGYYGTWDSKHKHFTRTHLKGDLRKTAHFGPAGATVDYQGYAYTAVWDTKQGENNAVYASGVGALSAFVGEINGNCGGNCGLSGTLYEAAGFQVENGKGAGTLAPAADVYNALNVTSSGYKRNPGFDPIDFFHPGAVNFRGYADIDPHGIASTHVPVVLGGNWKHDFHVETYPYDDLVDFSVHAWSVVRSVVPH